MAYKTHYIKSQVFFNFPFKVINSNLYFNKKNKLIKMEYSISTFLLSLISSALIVSYFKTWLTKNKFEFGCIPQGPRSWPIFGNLLQLGSRPYITFFNWSKTYGPIFRARLGSQDIVVLNGTDIIRDALSNHSDDFAGRPYIYMTHATLKGKGIISSPYNKDYDEHRKFLINSFNRFGRRRSSLETSCLHSIREILNEYRERSDDIFLSNSAQIKNHLSQITSQSVLTMTFGIEIHDKPKFSKLMDLVSENFQSTAVIAAYNFLPLTRIFKTTIMKNVAKCSEFLNSLITQRVENYTPNEEHNIIDSYLSEIINNMNNMSNVSIKNENNSDNNNNSSVYVEKLLNNESIELKATKTNSVQNGDDIIRDEERPKPRGRYKSFSFDHLNSIVQDLFIAGTETVSNAVNWAIVYAAYYPQYQEKIQNKIDDTIGKERSPCDDDRRKLPYVEAFINETLRYHCAGPILIPRSTTCDTSLKGYKLAKNTFVLVNMWSCMRDENYWNEPNKFDPDRFLDSNGNFVCKNPAMLPFSIGTRACIGESLARTELFLIFTSLLQKFTFYIEDDERQKNPNLLDGIPGISLIPPNVSIKMKLR